MQLSNRLKQIVEIVRKEQPISGEQIASLLGLTRAGLRPDLAILTMSGVLGAKPKVGYFYVGMDDAALVSQKLKEVRVGDIMSMPVAVTEDKSVYDTIVTMFLEDVGSIYIIKDGFLSGVVSRKDLLKTTLGGADIHRLPVAMAMTRMPNIIVTDKTESVVAAARKIIEKEIDSLPVVENAPLGLKIIGRLTKTNITRLFADLAGE